MQTDGADFASCTPTDEDARLDPDEQGVLAAVANILDPRHG